MEKLKYPTDLTGLKFGRLTVVRKVGVNKNYNSVWLCLCDCGNETETIRNSLVTQNTVSCGCRRKEGLIIGHKLMSKIKNPDIECNYCKTKFHVKRSRQEKTSKLFCSMKCKIEYSKTDKTVLGNYKNRDEITQYFYKKCTRLKMSAKKRGILFSNELNADFLITLWNNQQGKCYYSKVDMTTDSEDKLHLVSVDRVDNNKGYTKDNIVLCSYAFNAFKFNFTSQDILNFITEIKKIKL